MPVTSFGFFHSLYSHNQPTIYNPIGQIYITKAICSNQRYRHVPICTVSNIYTAYVHVHHIMITKMFVSVSLCQKLISGRIIFSAQMRWRKQDHEENKWKVRIWNNFFRFFSTTSEKFIVGSVLVSLSGRT